MLKHWCLTALVGLQCARRLISSPIAAVLCSAAAADQARRAAVRAGSPGRAFVWSPQVWGGRLVPAVRASRQTQSECQPSAAPQENSFWSSCCNCSHNRGELHCRNCLSWSRALAYRGLDVSGFVQDIAIAALTNIGSCFGSRPNPSNACLWPMQAASVDTVASIDCTSLHWF